jgi:hypothetical protein
MPKYAVEVQYLLPVWACVIVEAHDAKEAKRAVMFDDSGHTRDNAADDYEPSLPTTIAGCREISDAEIKALGDNPASEQLHDFIRGADTPAENPQK